MRDDDHRHFSVETKSLSSQPLAKDGNEGKLYKESFFSMLYLLACFSVISVNLPPCSTCFLAFLSNIFDENISEFSSDLFERFSAEF
jgi:hypothetical protein